MKDRSLDEFAGSGDESDGDAENGAETGAETDGSSEEDEGGDGGAEVTVTDDRDTPGGDPDPAAATSRWDPDGAACPRCGETVTRRWRADEENPSAEFVCTECKEW